MTLRRRRGGLICRPGQERMTASPSSKRPYSLEAIAVLADTPDLRMTVFTVGAYDFNLVGKS